MAVGSNALGLLFKIGVDAGDAKKAIDDLKSSVSTGLVQGFKEGAGSASKELEKTGDAFSKLLTPLNQARRGFDEVFSGDALEGTISLTRSLGPLGIAIGGVAIAAAGLGFAIKGAIDAAQEIGTTSKDDFDELQKKVQSAGESITELQRAMAQGVVAALDKISGASTALFAKILEKDGPALIALFQEIANFITGTLIPLVDKYGDRFADMIARTIALWRVLNKEFTLGDFLKGLPTLEADFAKALADVKAQIAGIHPVASALVDTTKAHAKATKDLTDAALEQAKAENALTLVRQDAAIGNKQINEDQAKGLITQEEGARRRIAVLAEVQKAEKAVLDARQKAVETDPTLLANQRAKQLDDIDTQRAVLRTQAAEAQREEDNKTIASDQKLHDAFAAHFAKLRQEWITYAEFIHKTTDQIVEDLARQAQAVPGGAGQGPIPGAPPQIPLPAPPTGFFDDLSKVLGQSQDQFETWGQAVGNILLQVGQATEQVFATFILTGKSSGQIFKKLAADIIASIAVQSIVKAIFEVAEGFAALAQIPFDPTAGYRASMHFHAAAIYATVGAAAAVTGLAIGAAGGLGGGGGASAAAGGGGFGGDSTAAPGTVTINQGGGTTLGILLSINDHLSNLTTASPGDVVTRGAEQNPMVIGQANNEAARRDGTVSREFLQISGLRPA
jgi:hypothetical protein